MGPFIATYTQESARGGDEEEEGKGAVKGLGVLSGSVLIGGDKKKHVLTPFAAAVPKAEHSP